MIVNMKAIYAPYHWFLSVKMLNRYTTSRTGTKYHEIQLRLPNSKFIMIPIFEPEIVKWGFWHKLPLLPLLWHANTVDEN